jgi:RNA polymerase sigma-70 factor (ECF subfamily)
MPALLRFAVRLTGSLYDGEDAVQEALLRVSKTWKELRELVAFRSWAFQILVNVVRDQHRRTSAGPVTSIGVGAAETTTFEVADDGARPDQIVELGELKEEIEAKLQLLPPRQREVMALLAFEPYTPQEVSQMLNIDVGNVYATLAVARSRLRQLLTLDSDFQTRCNES